MKLFVSLVVILAGVLAGCSSDPTSPVGSWPPVPSDVPAVPASLASDGGDSTILLVYTSAGDCSDSVNIFVTDDDDVVLEVRRTNVGHWSRFSLEPGGKYITAAGAWRSERPDDVERLLPEELAFDSDTIVVFRCP